ncbi:E4 ORF1 [Bat mastadenovirus WIV17]|uniref:E4 ORF1 n=1 Tax=Bat mastadenovirus WIV17 TaxID=1986505 RepID=A0A1X9RIS7_9ADEN|nr:E4 ORF1 [Bat mastadenovirus WIV17]ARQ79770.1 E4 ORF1 [Bat mastadenovirus WIV17]
MAFHILGTWSKKIIFSRAFFNDFQLLFMQYFLHSSAFPLTAVFFQMPCIKASQILLSVFFLRRESGCYTYLGIT